DAATGLARLRNETVETRGRMERNRGLLGKRDCDVPRVHRIATVFNLADRHFAAHVNNPHAADLPIRLAGRGKRLGLSAVDLVTVLIFEFAKDGVLPTESVTAASEVDDIPGHELRRIRCLQAAGDIVRIR